MDISKLETTSSKLKLYISEACFILILLFTRNSFKTLLLLRPICLLDALIASKSTKIEVDKFSPIDSYFSSAGLEKLEYRSINFKQMVLKNTPYFQPNSVVNYPQKQLPFTRIVEYKHFLNQQSQHTIIVSETTNDSGDPYYPVPDEKNLQLYEKYKKLAEEEKDILFLGRLANYKYFNMDQAILNSLEFFENNKDFFN